MKVKTIDLDTSDHNELKQEYMKLQKELMSLKKSTTNHTRKGSLGTQSLQSESKRKPKPVESEKMLKESFLSRSASPERKG